MDISYIDVNDLGVRPLNWVDTENDLDFDELSNGYFGKDKLDDFATLFQGEKLINNEENTTILDQTDDSNYEIDPETGMLLHLNDLSKHREKNKFFPEINLSSFFIDFRTNLLFLSLLIT